MLGIYYEVMMRNVSIISQFIDTTDSRPFE